MLKLQASRPIREKCTRMSFPKEFVPSERTVGHSIPMRPLPSRFFAHCLLTVIMVSLTDLLHYSHCENTERGDSFQMRHRGRCGSGVRSGKVGVTVNCHAENCSTTINSPSRRHLTPITKRSSVRRVLCMQWRLGPT